MKIAIIGAGSSYTIELIEKLSKMRKELPVTEIVMMDLDAARLNHMADFCMRYSASIGFDIDIRKTTDLKDAVKDSMYVITQLRVGGNLARCADEKIPLSYGLIGQETTGAGGFMKALRTIPAIFEIAEVVEDYAPDAWIINYANPTGIITEAVNKYKKAKIVGLCAGGMFARDWTASVLGVDPKSVRYDIAGLNHMNFSYNINVSGIPLTKEQLRLVAKNVGSVDEELIERIGAIPSPYLQYYYHTGERVKHLQSQKISRAEQILEIEKEIHKELENHGDAKKPESLKKRGGGGYSDLALGVMSAIYNDVDTWLVANVVNRGTIDFLPDDAVIEAACMVNGAGLRPLNIEPVPEGVRGLIASVKNYEQLAVRSAVEGSIEYAELALLAHPLVKDWEIIKELLPELLNVNKKWLNNFNILEK